MQEQVIKPDRNKRQSRKRPQVELRDAGSGQGAASALATWREIERCRAACEPVDEGAPERAGRGAAAAGVKRP